jgi:anaerobic glycerol-3-phosphate dehydrogenase
LCLQAAAAHLSKDVDEAHATITELGTEAATAATTLEAAQLHEFDAKHAHSEALAGLEAVRAELEASLASKAALQRRAESLERQMFDMQAEVEVRVPLP